MALSGLDAMSLSLRGKLDLDSLSLQVPRGVECPGPSLPASWSRPTLRALYLCASGSALWACASSLMPSPLPIPTHPRSSRHGVSRWPTAALLPTAPTAISWSARCVRCEVAAHARPDQVCRPMQLTREPAARRLHLDAARPRWPVIQSPVLHCPPLTARSYSINLSNGPRVIQSLTLLWLPLSAKNCFANLLNGGNGAVISSTRHRRRDKVGPL